MDFSVRVTRITEHLNLWKREKVIKVTQNPEKYGELHLIIPLLHCSRVQTMP